MGRIYSPETSVLNYLTPRNNPEDERIQLNCGRSLRHRIVTGFKEWESEVPRRGEVPTDALCAGNEAVSVNPEQMKGNVYYLKTNRMPDWYLRSEF